MQPNTRMTFRFEPPKPAQLMKPIQRPPDVKGRWRAIEEKHSSEESIKLEQHDTLIVEPNELKILNKLDLDMLDPNKLDLDNMDLDKLDVNKLDVNKLDLDMLDLDMLDPNKLDLDMQERQGTNIMDTYISSNSHYQDDIHALEDIIRKSDYTADPKLLHSQSMHPTPRSTPLPAATRSAVNPTNSRPTILLDKLSSNIKGFSNDKHNYEGDQSGYHNQGDQRAYHNQRDQRAYHNEAVRNGIRLESEWISENSQPVGEQGQSNNNQEGPSWGRVFLSVSAAIATGALFGYLVLSLFTGEPLFTTKSKANIQQTVQVSAGVIAQPSNDSISVVESNQVEGLGIGRSVETNATTVPAEDYFLLQYGVFQSEESMELALKQLQELSLNYTIIQDNGNRVYLGATRSRVAAEILAAQLPGIELYIKPVQIPSITIPAGSLPEGGGEYMTNTAELMGRVVQLSSYYLQDQLPQKMDEEDTSALEEANQRWLRLSTTAAEINKAPQEDGKQLAQALSKAVLSLNEYNQKPSRYHLWRAQSEAMNAISAYRSLLMKLQTSNPVN